MSDDKIKVLTLNCWGLKFVSKHRTERIAALAVELAKSDYDIITLQELWVYKDYEYVRDALSSKLRYAKFFHSGALGSGLVILSRFPIIATSIYPYSLNGEPTDVLAGDWIVGKAAAGAIIQHPILDQVQIFTTHLYAKGGEDGPEHVKAHRIVNAWEFSKLALQAAQLGRHVIACGDFNFLPESLPMTIIREHAGLRDAWTTTHQGQTSRTSPSPRIAAPLEAVQTYGVTADSPANSYSAGKPLDSHARKHLGKRLDYIFYRQPVFNPHSTQKSAPVIKAVESKVVFTERVPQRNFSFSDHFGLEVTLDIQPSNKSTEPGPESATDAPPLLGPGEHTIPASTITEMIHALTSRYRVSRIRARQELLICGLCVFLIVGVIVSSPWLPHSWINPIFLLFTVFITWLATTMLYEGFIYGRWEQNALMGVIEELEVYQKAGELERDESNRAR